MGTDVAALLEQGGWLLTYGAIFAGGLALNLTPCVYPLIPITVGFFAGGRETRPRRRVGLSLLYVLGIAVTYSGLGLAAALSGKMLGFLLQSPSVLALFSALMVALALSQFGVFELRVPSLPFLSLRQGAAEFQALGMGLLAGVVAAPCIGPFVLGLMLYVGQTGDPLTGFTMFLTLALGLGLPYFALALYASRLEALPRSGAWMVAVKKAFGFVLLAMALYFLKPLSGPAVYSYGLLALATTAAGAVLVHRPWRASLRGALAVGVAAVGLVAFGVGQNTSAASPSWLPYSKSVLQSARAEGKPMLIDFYADWCLPCKELDVATFSDAEVQEAAARIVMVKADVTLESSEASREGLERFEVQGVPTVVFLDAWGRERKELRVTSFVGPKEMLKRLRALEAGPD